jgi:hypothetical protein
MGVKFPMHVVTNYVLLRQREPDLAKPKLALSINTFNSLTLSRLHRVTKKTSASMKLKPRMFGGAQGGMALAKRSKSKN